MRTRRDLLKLRYWIHILLLEETRLVKKVYQQSKHTYLTLGKNNWTKTIHKLTKKYNFSHLWDNVEELANVPEDYNGDPKSYWWHQIWTNIQSYETKKWKEEMVKKPKLVHYQKIKTELELEKYLESETNAYQRKLFTLFRVGAYPLRIETGRWYNEEKERRLCMKCMSGDVEDELHFLFECKAYEVCRRELYLWLRKNRVKGNPEKARKENKWLVLMIGDKPAICNAMTCFIREAVKIREKL
jgi:hypothetical protein